MEGVRNIPDLKQAAIGKDIICTDSLHADKLPDFRDYQITPEVMPNVKLLNPCPPFYRGEEVSAEVVHDGVDENDIIYSVTYDIKARSNPENLTIENGEIKGQWIRGAYVCGYLKCISEDKYRLYSIGTGF